MPDDALIIDVTTEGAEAHVELTGELTGTEAADLLAAVDRACRDGATTVRLEMHGVTFLDSSGLAGLLQSRDRATGTRTRLTIVEPSAIVTRVLNVTQVGPLFDIDGHPPGPPAPSP